MSFGHTAIHLFGSHVRKFTTDLRRSDNPHSRPEIRAEPQKIQTTGQKFARGTRNQAARATASLPVPLTDIDTEVGQCVAVFGRFVFGEHGHRPREVFLHDAGRLFHTALVLDDVLQIFDRLISPSCNAVIIKISVILNVKHITKLKILSLFILYAPFYLIS